MPPAASQSASVIEVQEPSVAQHAPVGWQSAVAQSTPAFPEPAAAMQSASVPNVQEPSGAPHARRT